MRFERAQKSHHRPSTRPAKKYHASIANIRFLSELATPPERRLVLRKKRFAGQASKRKPAKRQAMLRKRQARSLMTRRKRRQIFSATPAGTMSKLPEPRGPVHLQLDCLLHSSVPSQVPDDGRKRIPARLPRCLWHS